MTPKTPETEKKETFLTVDKTILCLFPSLDFNRNNVHANSKKRMNTMLKILDSVAKNGSVTKYDLTKRTKKEKDKAVYPRMGSDSAQDALQELEDLELLAAYETINSKMVLTFPKFLTAKGVIACLALPEFQKQRKMEKILKRSTLKESKLAFFLKIYNDENPLVKAQFRDIVQEGCSILVSLIKMLGERKFNLELKTQEELLNDIKNIMNELVNEKLQFSCFDHHVTNLAFLSGFMDRNEEMKKATDDFIVARNAVVNNEKPSAKMYEDLCEKVALMHITSEKRISNDKDYANKIKLTAQNIESMLKTCIDPVQKAIADSYFSDVDVTKIIFEDTKKNAKSNAKALRKIALEQTEKEVYGNYR